MKWLVVTTIGKNPGDEFIRVGLANMIREVDPDAEAIGVDKETPAIHQVRDFDRCVLAGMPVFWSYYDNNFWNIDWWRAISGWLSEDPSKFCILGAGSFQNWSDVSKGLAPEYPSEVKRIADRSHIVTLRDPVTNVLTGMNLPVLPCPALYAPMQYKEQTEQYDLCNLMRAGAHYGNFNPEESHAWQDKVRPAAEILKSKSYKFMAHNANEIAFARELGWSDDDVIKYDGTPGSLLPYYRNCRSFFGNRVHGAIVSRYNSARVLSCGIDSRQEAVRLTGASVMLPSDLDLSKLEKWCDNKTKQPCDVQVPYEKYIDILSGFANI